MVGEEEGDSGEEEEEEEQEEEVGERVGQAVRRERVGEIDWVRAREGRAMPEEERERGSARMGNEADGEGEGEGWTKESEGWTTMKGQVRDITG